MNFQVEGQIDLMIDESSSSDEDNDDINNYINNNEEQDDNNNDDDEELEFFGDKPSSNNNSNSNAQIITNKAQSSHLKESKNHLSSLLNINDHTPDEFGISYKAYRPLLDPNNSNNNNTLNAIDEYSEDISLRLLANKASIYSSETNNTDATTNEDDEFDLALNDEVASKNQSINSSNDLISSTRIENELAIQRAIASTAAKYSSEETTDFRTFYDENVSESLDISRIPLQDIPITSESVDKPSEDTEVDSTGPKINILEEAKKAYREVSEVYGSGLGDQEVLLLANQSNPTANTAYSKDILRGIHLSIEEGDEDAAEEEDNYMYMKEQEEVEKYLQEQLALESEWNDVNHHMNTTRNHKEENATIASFTPVITSKEDSLTAAAAAATTTTTTTTDDNIIQGSDTMIASQLLNTQITYTKALIYFQSQDLSKHLPNICTSESHSDSGKSSLSWFRSTTVSTGTINYPGSEVDLTLPFLIAQIDYDISNTWHRNMLSTIYHTFINNCSSSSNIDIGTVISNWDYQIASIGSHWEDLGFQGSDPRTDLNRSMKMLSILQVLYLIENDYHLAKHAFDISESNRSNTISSSSTVASASAISIKERNLLSKDDISWPFMLVSISFTKEAIQVLRKGYLNEKCNKKQSVFQVLNDFYKACFLEFLSLLKEKPLIHHAIHLSTVRKQCETASTTLKLLKTYKQQLIPHLDSSSINTITIGSDKNNNYKFDKKNKVININVKNINNKNITITPPTIDKELQFDDLENLKESDLHNTNMTVVTSKDTQNNNPNSNSSSWLNMMFSNDRSSRFKVADDINHN